MMLPPKFASLNPNGKYLIVNADDYNTDSERNRGWRKALRRAFDVKEVEEEFAAQLERLLASGIMPDHIDGNNHLHVFPGIAQAAALLAQRYGIARIRLPLEPFSSWQQLLQRGSIKKFCIGLLSRRVRTLFAGCGLRFTDHFAGMQFPDTAKAASLKAFLARLPEGTTELMCHPGFENRAENPFSTTEREQELNALTCAEVLAEVRRQNIQRISYSEI